MEEHANPVSTESGNAFLGQCTRSRYGDITTAKQAKHDLADVRTLHALITEPADPSFTGTEFILHGAALGERQVEEAKALFLRYSGDEERGVTPFGTVLRSTNARARARTYVNGLLAAELANAPGPPPVTAQPSSLAPLLPLGVGKRIHSRRPLSPAPSWMRACV